MSSDKTAAADYYIETALFDEKSGLGARVLFVPKHFLGDMSPSDAAHEIATALGVALEPMNQGAFSKALAALLYEDEFVRTRGIDAFYKNGPATPGQNERTAAEAILKSKIVVEQSPPELQLLTEILKHGHGLLTSSGAYSSFALIPTALALLVVCPMGKRVGTHVGDAIGTVISDLIFALRDAMFPALKKRGGAKKRGAIKKTQKKKPSVKVVPLRRAPKTLPTTEEQLRLPGAAAATRKVAAAKKTRKKKAAAKKVRKVAKAKKARRVSRRRGGR